MKNKRICWTLHCRVMKSTKSRRLNAVMFLSEQQHCWTPLISVFGALNGLFIRLKCGAPLGLWVRSHHCLCHHLLWLPNLRSRNQGSQTSTETNTMEIKKKKEEGGAFWDFTQAAMASTHLIEHKVSHTALLHREHKQPNAWHDNCEVILSARNATRVGIRSCQRWPEHRQPNMLLS